MTTGQNESDRIAASAILVQLGAAQANERAVLTSGLSSKDPQARRLAVELGDAERPALVPALSDTDAAVRLAAARKLAAQGFHDGATVLRATAAGGNSEGLLAYIALRKLGELLPLPPGLASLLASGDLPTRLQVLDILLEFPPDDVQRLIRIALLDPLAMVRRRGAEVAAKLYRQTQQIIFLRMVRSLRNDPDVIVRAQATSLLEELDRLPKTAHPPDLGQAPNLAHPTEPIRPILKDGIPTAQGMGEIMVDGEETVRFQIDKNPPQLINGQRLAISAGKHHISYLGGAQDIQVLPRQTLQIRIPVSLAVQLLQDGKDALNRKDFQRAQESLDRLRRLVQRGKASPSLQADLFYQQARLYEAHQQLDAALAEYNRALNVPERQRRPDMNAALRSTLARLSSRSGRIQIFTLVDGRCQMTRELLSPPGQQVISVGKGQTKTVYALVGSITKVTACP